MQYINGVSAGESWRCNGEISMAQLYQYGEISMAKISNVAAISGESWRIIGNMAGLINL
jgi:hypothetical protein